MTLTIEVPDETAAYFKAVAAERGLDLDTFAVTALLDAAEETPSDSDDTRELVEVVAEASALYDSGERGMPMTTAFAEIRRNLKERLARRE